MAEDARWPVSAEVGPFMAMMPLRCLYSPTRCMVLTSTMVMPRPAGERRASRLLEAWRSRYRSMASLLHGFQLMLRLTAADADRNGPTMTSMA
eukprot:5631263-Heterocapsa_arctica.AAC.1